MKIRIKYFKISILMLYVSVIRLYSTWHNANYAYRKNITGMYARGGGALTNFPVLISISNDISLSNYAKTNGADICFYASNSGALLDHEIEYYTNGTLIAWIKMPALTASSNENTVYMYYGYPASTPMQNPTNVWDVYYASVWHKNDSNATSIHDSSVNVKHGTKIGAGEPAQAAGKIGWCQQYDGVNDAIDTGHPFADAMLNEVTVSLWVKLNDLSMDHGVISKSWGGNGDQIGIDIVRYLAVSDKYSFLVGNGTTFSRIDSFPVSLSEWNYISCVKTDTDLFIYVNGNYSNKASTLKLTNNAAVSMKIGSAFGGARRLKGAADEIRVSTNARSAGWILTEYSNQGFPDNFYTIGSAFDGLDISFSVYPTIMPEGVPLVFSNQSTGIFSITNSIFNFGDGTSATNTGTNVLQPFSKIFDVPGTYTNWLTAVTTKPERKSNSAVITVIPYTPVRVDFAVIGEPVTGHKVTFLDSTVCTIAPLTNWKIEFGDGESYVIRGLTSTYSVSHYYGTSGVFNAILTVVDANGFLFSTNKTITVSDYGAGRLGNMKKNIYRLDADFPLAFTYRFQNNEEKCYMRVVSLSGRLVNEYLYTGSAGRDALFLWNGCDSRGYKVTSGVYFLIVQIIGNGERLDEFYEYLLLY